MVVGGTQVFFFLHWALLKELKLEAKGMRPGFGTDFSDGYKAKSSEVFKVLLRFSKFSSYCVGLSSGEGLS